MLLSVLSHSPYSNLSVQAKNEEETEIVRSKDVTETMSENEDFENKYMNTFEDEDEEQMQFESEQGLEDSDEN